jgi:hypothetical protein
MRKLLLKTSFIVCVVFLTLVFLVAAQLLLEALLQSAGGRTGHYRGGDRLLQGILVMFGCLYAANRIVSVVFARTGLSDRRWSVLARRTFG